jgi:histidinol dehydrogenase
MALYLKQAKERPSEDLTRVRETVREIIDRVRREGEAGVRHYSTKFDNWSPKSFKVGSEEIAAVKSRLPATMVADIDFCQS